MINRYFNHTIYKNCFVLMKFHFHFHLLIFLEKLLDFQPRYQTPFKVEDIGVEPMTLPTEVGMI